MKKSLSYLFQWIIISVTAGITGAIMVAIFFSALTRSSTIILSSSIPFPFWTIGGALLCGLLFYRLSPRASGDGIPSYIHGVLDKKGVYSFGETMAKMGATLLALCTLSSGGMLGPAGRVSAGLNSQIVKYLGKLNLVYDSRRIAAICGMSAAVGAIFHSPVGGGIFAVEVLQRANMRYSDLFPAILSSSVAVYIYRFFPLNNPLHFHLPEGIFNESLMLPILITSLAAAFMGRLYTFYFDFISTLFRKGNRQKIILKLFLGALTASSVVYFFSPDMAGNIKGLTFAVIEGNVIEVLPLFSTLPLIVLYVLFIIVTATSTTVSIASGISVGLTSPSIVIGLLTGATSALIMGYNPGDPAYYFLLVAGFTGLLSSTINVPIGAAVIAIESFGASYGFCAGISSIIGFQVNRHHTLYDYTVSYTD